MEEQEAPLEDVQEEIHHHAEHGRERWVMLVAMSTALLAAVAAIASLLSGDNVNEAMLEQIRASDQWSYYQAKGLKESMLTTRIELLESSGAPVKAEDRARKDRYAKEQQEIKQAATELEGEADHHMRRHHKMAMSVTWSQIAIAISAISVLTKQRWLWLVGLALGGLGVAFLMWGVMI